MLPGVGKTYAMLQAAQTEAIKGLSIIVGYVDRNVSPENRALLDGLTIAPPAVIKYKDAFFEEMDVAAILAMRPNLVLVTDMAHTNAPGSRNLKRYHDIQELLANGINIYTTLNVIDLESCAEEVFQMMGISTGKTIPDEFFEQADEVELVDATPNTLYTRLAKNTIYTEGYSEEVINNIFRKEKIIALRKLAFRMMVDRMTSQRKYIGDTYKNKRRLLVIIGHDTVSSYAIRRAKAMACVLDADWIALYVETDRILNENEKKTLADNIKLTRQLEGNIITRKGNDMVKICMEVARRENITHIIVGKSGHDRSWGYKKKRFINQLIEKCDNINVYVVNTKAIDMKRERKYFPSVITSKYAQYLVTMIASIILGIICVPLVDKTDYPFLPFVVLLALFIAVIVLRIGPIILFSLLTVMTMIVFYLPPRFSLQFDTSSDIWIFLIYFSVAMLNGIFAIRFREQGIQAVAREKQTNALFLLTMKLGNAADVKEVIEAGMENIRKYFGVDAFFIFQDEDGHLTDQQYIPKGLALTESELETAVWASKHDMTTGRFTDVLPSGKYTYYPLKGPSVKLGVVVAEQQKPFDGKTTIFWDAFLAQIAQAIEHQYLGQIARKTSLLNESDKLYKTLFNSISHELRIPVATIMGASDILLSAGSPEHVKTALYGEILDATQRLNRLIENLLNMSRLESGRIAVHADWFDIHDLFHRVTESLAEELKPFRLVVAVPQSAPLVKLDFGLMEQVIYNLVYNSSIYAYPGTTICLRGFYKDGQLVIYVMDRGAGFEPDDLPFVFDKFWRYKRNETGGLGLGLSIVKGFVEAHKGTVIVENRKKGGARFIITIPTEVSIENGK